MSEETAIPHDPSQPPLAGDAYTWNDVAQDHTSWHPGLQKPAKVLLEKHGVSAPTPEIAQPTIDVDAVVARIAECSYSTPADQKPAYGLAECLDLLASDNDEAVMAALRYDLFTNLDDSAVQALLNKGLDPGYYLNAFSSLDGALAHQLVGLPGGGAIFRHRSVFRDFDAPTLVDEAVTVNQGLSVVVNLEKLPEIQDAELLPKLLATEQFSAILHGVHTGHFADLDQQDLVNRMKAKGDVWYAISAIGDLPNVDRQDLLQYVRDSGTATEIQHLLEKYDYFPGADRQTLFDKMLETYPPKTMGWLAYGVRDGKYPGLQQSSIDRLGEKLFESRENDYYLLQALQIFPKISHQALADRLLEVGDIPEDSFGGIKLLRGSQLQKFEGLTAETLDRILETATQDWELMYCGDALSSFQGISPKSARRLCDYSVNPVKLIEHMDLVQIERHEFINMLFDVPEGAGMRALLYHLDTFADYHEYVAEKLLTSGDAGVDAFWDNQDKFPNIDPTTLPDKLLHAGPSGVYILLNKAADYGIDYDALRTMLRDSGDPTLQLLANDEQLLSLLPADGPFGAAFGKTALRLLMTSADPVAAQEQLHTVTKQQALWQRNLLISQIGVGEVGTVGHLSEYIVDMIPLAFPVAAKDGEYSGNASLRRIADLSDAEKAMVLSPAATETATADTQSVVFSELSSDWQQNILAYRLYESIGKSRDADLRAAATESNRRFAETGSWWHEGDLVHSTRTATNVSNILRNGLLCGEVTGIQATADLYPYNVDFVTVSRDVMVESGHEARVAALKNQNYGGYTLLLHRTEESTDYGREMGRGINVDHRLVFGAVPATEISALLLRGELVDPEMAIDTVVESGLYIPVLDAAGKKFPDL